MKDLFVRFLEVSYKYKEKFVKMEELKIKVEFFENFLEKFYIFLEIKIQVFIEVDVFGKDVIELFQYMQVRFL